MAMLTATMKGMADAAFASIKAMFASILFRDQLSDQGDFEDLVLGSPTIPLPSLPSRLQVPLPRPEAPHPWELPRVVEPLVIVILVFLFFLVPVVFRLHDTFRKCYYVVPGPPTWKTSLNILVFPAYFLMSLADIFDKELLYSNSIEVPKIADVDKSMLALNEPLFRIIPLTVPNRITGWNETKDGSSQTVNLVEDPHETNRLRQELAASTQDLSNSVEALRIVQDKFSKLHHDFDDLNGELAAEALKTKTFEKNLTENDLIIKELLRQKSQVDKKLTSLEERVVADKSASEHESDLMKKRTANLQLELDGKSSEVLKLTNELFFIRKSAATACDLRKKEIDSYDSTIEALKRSLDERGLATRRHKEAAKEEQKHIRKTIEDLGRDLENANLLSESLKVELTAATKSLADAGVRQDLAKEAASSQSQMIKEQEERINVSTLEVQTLTQNLSTTQGEITQVEKALGTAQHTIETQEKLIRQLQCDIKENSRLSQSFSNSLSTSQESLRVAEARNDKTEKEFASLQQALQVAKSDLRAKTLQFSTLEQTFDKRLDELRKTDSEQTCSKVSTAQKSTIESNEKATREAELLKEQLKEANADIQSRTITFSNLQEKCNVLETELNEVEFLIRKAPDAAGKLTEVVQENGVPKYRVALVQALVSEMRNLEADKNKAWRKYEQQKTKNKNVFDRVRMRPGIEVAVLENREANFWKGELVEIPPDATDTLVACDPSIRPVVRLATVRATQADFPPFPSTSQPHVNSPAVTVVPGDMLHEDIVLQSGEQPQPDTSNLDVGDDTVGLATIDQPLQPLEIKPRAPNASEETAPFVQMRIGDTCWADVDFTAEELQRHQIEHQPIKPEEVGMSSETPTDKSKNTGNVIQLPTSAQRIDATEDAFSAKPESFCVEVGMEKSLWAEPETLSLRSMKDDVAKDPMVVGKSSVHAKTSKEKPQRVASEAQIRAATPVTAPEKPKTDPEKPRRSGPGMEKSKWANPEATNTSAIPKERVLNVMPAKTNSPSAEPGLDHSRWAEPRVTPTLATKQDKTIDLMKTIQDSFSTEPGMNNSRWAEPAAARTVAIKKVLPVSAQPIIQDSSLTKAGLDDSRRAEPKVAPTAATTKVEPVGLMSVIQESFSMEPGLDKSRWAQSGTSEPPRRSEIVEPGMSESRWATTTSLNDGDDYRSLGFRGRRSGRNNRGGRGGRGGRDARR